MSVSWFALALALAVPPSPPSSSPSPSSSSTAPSTAPSSSPLSPSTPDRRLLRIAVADVTGDGSVEARVARLFAESVVAELRKLERTSVIGMDEVRAMLAVEANRQQLGCSDEGSCLADVADALGADVLVSGAIATLDGQRVLSLKRIDQRNARVAAAFDERLVAAGGEELLAAIGPAVAKLFADVPLRAGEVRGVAAEKARLLHPPPVPVWATIGAAGTAVLVAAAAATTGVLAQSTAADAQQALDSSAATSPVDGGVLVEKNNQIGQLATASNLLWVSAGLAAVGAAVLVPFTDWTNAQAAINE